MKSTRWTAARIFSGLMVCAWLLLPGAAGAEEFSEYGNAFTWVTIGDVQIRAEVVASPEKLYLGLGNRPGLPEGRGMLFFMPALAVQYFCMRDMQFPIDIVWLLPGKVAGIARNVPPDYHGELASPVPVQHVLEVPGGFCDRYGIKVGDPVRW